MRLCSVSIFVIIFLIDLAVGTFRAPCPLPTIKNGRVRLKQKGRWAKFFCLPGYTLVGDKNAFCRAGQWDVTMPKCTGTSCPSVNKSPLNSFIISNSREAVLTFYCKPGFTRRGPLNIYCDGDTWDNSPPTCIASDEKPRLFCDFESEDLCHWNQDINHDMDWKRDQYKTPTGYSMPTGPSYDHTKGTSGDGYYMYLETSSRRINDTARLVSPIFEHKNTGGCLEFWYHMYGKTIGTLRAYLRKVSQPWEFYPNSSVFTKTGNQGNVWLRAFIDLGNLTEDYQIIMEGSRGNGFVSDIAIDDIKIIENCDYAAYLGSTEQPESSTETPKPIESCENRCGHRASDNEKAQYIICDCDESCDENSRCCPDFIDICFEGTTTTEMDTTTIEYFTEKATYTSEILHIHKDTNLYTPGLLKPTIRTLSTPSTTSTTPKTTTTIITTVPVQKKTLPPIILLKPSTVQQIYRKTFSPNYQPFAGKNVSIPKKPSTNVSENDIVELPIHPHSESPLEDDIPIQEKEEYVEKVVNDKTMLESKKHENLYEIKTGFSQKPTNDSTYSIAFTVLEILGGVCVALLSVLIVWRYRKRRNQMTSGNGDSQSDVRFLTADEVLDFSLDKGYDEL